MFFQLVNKKKHVKKWLPGEYGFQNRGLAHYALKYPRNYIRCRSRGSTSERF